MSSDDGFVSRWSRRKAQVRTGQVPVDPPPAPVAARLAPLVTPAQPPAAPEAVAEAPQLPTLEDVAALTHDSDYSRFVKAGVAANVKNAAMKKLFSDPQFNIMDGLDTYIEDYGIPDPIPEATLRRMTQSKFLRLFDDEDKAEAPSPGASTDGAADAALPQSGNAPVAPPEPLPDENTALRLQPDDAPGPAGAGPDRSGPGA